MKIAYSHLVSRIKGNPTIEMLSSNLFQLGHEHEIEGNIFNMEFTPNRGDCLSVTGLLRDLAVFYEVDLVPKISNEKLDTLELDFINLSQEVCPNISFLKLEIEKIPQQYKGCLKHYFSDLKLNKTNFFTDVSNYLSYEVGQPTHCYDADKINGKIIFKETDIECEFETLFGNKIKLNKKNAVFLINNEVINLAGIIGGMNTSCSTKTVSVLVECAFFVPEAIIGKSVKYDIKSEAAHKFERSVDPKCHDMVLRRFINLVSENANIKDVSIVSYNNDDSLKKEKIPVNVQKINEIIGTNINENEYLHHLLNLGFDIKEGLITVPSYRSDVNNQNDLAEEVARIIGYDNIKRQELKIPDNNKNNHTNIENKLRYFLLDHGFYELINFPFISKARDNSIRVDNPLDSNRGYLRTCLKDSLINNLTFNERRQKESIKLFEISDIYTSQGNEIKKTRKLAIIASGRVGNNFEDFSKKITKKYLTDKFQATMPHINFDFQIISRESMNTKIKNEIVYSEIEISNLSNDLIKYDEITKPPSEFVQYLPISDLPCSKRDLSFSIKDQLICKPLEQYILGFKNDLLKEVFMFDYYYNEKIQETKIGFRFIFQSKDATITDSEVESVMAIIIDKALEFESVSIPGLS